MRISLNWINDYVDIKNEKPRDMAEKITRAGINVEGVKTIDISNLVIGYVEDKWAHPDSDHLNVCKVNLGNETVQIVCGAPNVDKGQKVIVAREGAILPGGFEIKKASIRGVESNGMICALFELGLEDKETNYHKGIHVLGEDAVAGGDPLAYMGLDDTVYELDLNPNRNDCLSHIGFAYEVASVLDKKVKMPRTDSNPISDSIKDYLTLNVDTANCKMYRTRMVKDVVIGESPTFIKNRLRSAGMRPINNVVDISNYIMLEYGQPLHFFDKDKVGNNITVRMANDNEHTVTLDGKDRTLIKDDIVITNGNDVVAIAGVMGCANSEVDDNTKNILIESAIFNPYNVRYTSIRLDLRSEASLRFEKVLNYEYTKEAIDRACYLLEEYASGKVLSDEITFDEVDKTPKVAVVSKDKINAVLGMELSNEDIMHVFDRLSFKVDVTDEIYTVTIPNRRMDVSIKEDLIEEVGCLYGYDNIIGKMPIGPIKAGSYNDSTLFRKQVSKRMRSLGLNEIKTYSLISKEESNTFKYHSCDDISLLLPMSMDKSIVRQSLIPSLLKTVEYNAARSIKDINIYEISNVYYKKDGNYIEDTKLSIGMLGNYIYNTWQNNIIKVDFYVMKGILENLFTYLGLNERYSFKVSENIPSELHPGISAEIMVDGMPIGYLGMINPSISKLPLYICEISLKELYDKKAGNIKYKEASKFPSITKDVAFILDKIIPADDIIKLIKKTGGKVLTDINIFDVYSGSNIDENKKSIAFSLTFADTNKTLTEGEVNAVLSSIINEVESKYHAILRSK